MEDPLPENPPLPDWLPILPTTIYLVLGLLVPFTIWIDETSEYHQIEETSIIPQCALNFLFYAAFLTTLLSAKKETKEVRWIRNQRIKVFLIVLTLSKSILNLIFPQVSLENPIAKLFLAPLIGYFLAENLDLVSTVNLNWIYISMVFLYSVITYDWESIQESWILNLHPVIWYLLSCIAIIEIVMWWKSDHVDVGGCCVIAVFFMVMVPCYVSFAMLIFIR